MKNKKSEEIKPWTHRQRQTSIQLNIEPTAPLNREINPFTTHNGNILRQKTIHQINRNKLRTELRPTIPEKDCNNSLHHKINANTKENQMQYTQIVPNCKVIRFQNNRPRYSNSSKRTKSKDKYTPNTVYSNRQHISQLFGQIKKQQKSRSEEKIKARRYYTEQKDQEPVKISITANKQPDLSKMCKTQGIRKCQFAIKIIKTSKGMGIIEQQIKRGKIYDKVQTMLDSSLKQGGHLSQMKRNYNIKKLLKLLKEEQL